MALQTTMKSVKENYGVLIQIPYADLSYLLMYAPKTAYTAGVYGWNASIYDMSYIDFSGVAIVTGYRPFGNTKPERAFYKHYNDEARRIYNDDSILFPDKKQKTLELLRDFIKNIIARS